MGTGASEEGLDGQRGDRGGSCGKMLRGGRSDAAEGVCAAAVLSTSAGVQTIDGDDYNDGTAYRESSAPPSARVIQTRGTSPKRAS